MPLLYPGVKRIRGAFHVYPYLNSTVYEKVRKICIEGINLIYPLYMHLLPSLAHVSLQLIFGTSWYTGMLNKEPWNFLFLNLKNFRIKFFFLSWKAKNWKQSKSLSSGEEKNKLCVISIQWNTIRNKKEWGINTCNVD